MNRYGSILLWLLLSTIAIGQQNLTINGTVKDAETKESLIGVTLVFKELNKGVVTNNYGFYSISIPEGTHTLLVGYLGYETQEINRYFGESNTINLELKPAQEALEEVVVTETNEQISIKRPQMSVNRLSANNIRQTPVVFGEADLLKALQLLPGVTNAGEGTGGFNVRGGAADQNLILLDEATLFNSSHLFGFFSVFNPDAIKDLTLYKGGIPAKYGGRLSSVLDIYQKEGNSSRFSGNGGIGLVASRLLLEGPINNGKGSFLVGGRGTYAHLFLALADNPNRAYFYDLNTKISYRLNDKNKLYLSGYFGRDVFNVNQSFVNTYGNAVFNLRWNQLLSDKLFSNLSLIYSDYYYGLTLDFVGFNWDSGIRNFNLKYDFNYYLKEGAKMGFGLQSTYYSFNPGNIAPNRPDSGINPEQLDKKYALESALYLDFNYDLSNQLSFNAGVRFSHFARFGQTGLQTYNNDQAVRFNTNLGIYQSATPTGRFQNTSSSEVIKTYFNLEPRFTLALGDDRQAWKLSYNRLYQYLHLISNTNAPTPLDVWAPSGPYLKPQQLDQWAVGYFIDQNEYSIEVETFYKDIQNRLDYIDGADLVANKAIERVLIAGKARAYGLEFLLKKTTGAFKGQLAYTYSKSEQITTGLGLGDPGINQGKWYSTPHDKTHDIGLTGSYQWSKQWQLAFNAVFQTGQPITYPNGQYAFLNLRVPSYNLRNGDRLPNYHRLDISATYHPKKQKKWSREWVFGIYNLYNRRNATSIAFRRNKETMQNEAVQFSLFGIVPAVTYNIKF